MGYACPVCGDPQADADHLANHLAFTAMLGDDDHESWLATHAPDWDEADAASLATVVTDHAAQVEYPQVFEDTTDDERTAADADSAAPFEGEFDAARSRAADAQDPDADTAAILDEARDLTRRMREEGTEETDDAADEPETE